MPSLETTGRSRIHLLTIDICMNTIENHKQETTDIYIISSFVNISTKILECNLRLSLVLWVPAFNSALLITKLDRKSFCEWFVDPGLVTWLWTWHLTLGGEWSVYKLLTHYAHFWGIDPYNMKKTFQMYIKVNDTFHRNKDTC